MHNKRLLEYIIGILILFGILFRGSFFTLEISLILIPSIIICIYFVLQSRCLNTITLLLIIFSIILFLYVFITEGNPYTSFTYYVKFLILPLFSMMILNLNNRRIFYDAVIKAALILAALGFVMYIGLFQFPAGIVINNGINSLQSFTQYANTLAIILLSAYLITKNREEKLRNEYTFFILISALLTFSIGSLIIFGIVIIIKIYDEKKLYIYDLLEGVVALIILWPINHYSLTDAQYISIIVLILSGALMYFLEKKLRTKVISISPKQLFVTVVSSILSFGIIIFIVSKTTCAHLLITIFDSFIERLIYMNDAFLGIIKNPFGNGLGSFESLQYGLQTAQYYTKYIHNSLLQIFFESGIHSFVLFIIILFMAFKHVIKTKNHLDKYLLTLIILHSLIDIDLYFGAILIILVGCLNSDKKLNLKKLHSGLIVVFLIFSLSITTYAFASEVRMIHLNNLISEEKYEEALTVIDNNRILRMNDATVELYRANLLINIKSPHQDIIDAFDKAIAINPNEATYYEDKYSYLHAKSDEEQAYTVIKELLEIRPMSISGYNVAINQLGIVANEVNYEEELKEILNLQERAKNKINPLAKYIPNQQGFDSSEKLLPFQITSDIVLVYDLDKSQFIVGKNIDQATQIGSVTKLMILYIAFEEIANNRLSLDEMVTISESASSIGGSEIGLNTGDMLSVNDLLYCIALPSGNDAAAALAERIAGSMDDFILVMNDKAKALNLNNTHYSNLVGFSEKTHYSTANDLAILVNDFVQKYPEIYDIVGEQQASVTISLPSHETKTSVIKTTNPLLSIYDGMTGFKTGSTEYAGYCLVSTARKDNKNRLVIVLNAPTKLIRREESIRLLDYAFSQ